MSIGRFRGKGYDVAVVVNNSNNNNRRRLAYVRVSLLFRRAPTILKMKTTAGITITYT